jgi:hypothetical protein
MKLVGRVARMEQKSGRIILRKATIQKTET